MRRKKQPKFKIGDRIRSFVTHPYEQITGTIKKIRQVPWDHKGDIPGFKPAEPGSFQYWVDVDNRPFQPCIPEKEIEKIRRKK